MVLNTSAMSLPESVPTALQFPQPPSGKDTMSDPAATLAWLETTIATIYLAARTPPTQDKPPSLARSAYANLYTAAHHFCEVTKLARTSPRCDDLYQFLWDQIRTHCSEVRAHIYAPENSTGVDDARHTVEDYLAQWHQFTSLAGLISRLLSNLDRAWIKRGIDEGKKDRYFIKDLHNVVWKNEILKVGVDSTEAEQIASAVKRLREQPDDGFEGDKALVDSFVKSLEDIGVRPVGGD